VVHAPGPVPQPDEGLCLPPENLTLAGFAQNGEADTMTPPGPLLATVVHTVTGEDGKGPAGCSDDQLMGRDEGNTPVFSRHPGEAGGFGLLDGDAARDLIAAAARHPSTRAPGGASPP
jgi:hypothetical protein